MRSSTLAAAAVFLLSPVNFDFMDAWADTELIPAWPNCERKRVWPDGPVRDFLHDLQRPDNDRHPDRDKHARAHAAMRAIPSRPNSR
jgi:hypothetical protein